MVSSLSSPESSLCSVCFATNLSISSLVAHLKLSFPVQWYVYFSGLAHILSMAAAFSGVSMTKSS